MRMRAASKRLDLFDVTDFFDDSVNNLLSDVGVKTTNDDISSCSRAPVNPVLALR